MYRDHVRMKESEIKNKWGDERGLKREEGRI
jgi:hypothetical protein